MATLTYLFPVLPEVFLAVAALALLMLGVFMGDKATRLVTSLAALALLAVTTYLAGLLGAGLPGTFPGFGNLVALDALSATLKLLVAGGATLVLALSLRSLRLDDIARIEYPVLILLSVLGMMLMLSSTNFLMLYLGLELQSLALYILAAFRRDHSRSTEAGMKYFVLGALASGLLLFGISYLYGFTGSTDFSVIANAIAGGGEPKLGIIIGALFVLAAMAFKLAAAPFQMWAPDVYEGSPTIVTTFFAIVPKAAALGILIKVLFIPLLPLLPLLGLVIALLAAASLIVGALGAIGQKNIKRLLAYSSIGHVGFLLTALAAGNREGIYAALIYLVFYMIMALGAFGIVLLLRRKNEAAEEIADLAGLSRSQPGLAAAMAVLMFSMAGIPPMVGFFTKVYVLLAAINAGLLWLAILAVLASVVSAFYYIRLVKIMYFDEPAAELEVQTDDPVRVTVVVATILTLVGLTLIGPIGELLKFALNVVPLP